MKLKECIIRFDKVIGANDGSKKGGCLLEKVTGFHLAIPPQYPDINPPSLLILEQGQKSFFFLFYTHILQCFDSTLLQQLE